MGRQPEWKSGASVKSRRRFNSSALRQTLATVRKTMILLVFAGLAAMALIGYIAGSHDTANKSGAGGAGLSVGIVMGVFGYMLAEFQL